MLALYNNLHSSTDVLLQPSHIGTTLGVSDPYILRSRAVGELRTWERRSLPPPIFEETDLPSSVSRFKTEFGTLSLFLGVGSVTGVPVLFKNERVSHGL